MELLEQIVLERDEQLTAVQQQLALTQQQLAQATEQAQALTNKAEGCAIITYKAHSYGATAIKSGGPGAIKCGWRQ